MHKKFWGGFECPVCPKWASPSPRVQQSTSKFRNLPQQAKERTAHLRKRVGGLAVTTLP